MTGPDRRLVAESAVVAAGAMAGAATRWAVGSAIGARPGGLPLATLTVNLVGCLLAGLATRRLARDSWAWIGCVTGLLGGLTTFSAFSVETRALLADGRPLVALAYVGASVGGGLGLANWARRRPAP